MEKSPGDSLTKTPCRNLDGLFVSVSSLLKFSVLCFSESIAVTGVWGPHGGDREGPGLRRNLYLMRRRHLKFVAIKRSNVRMASKLEIFSALVGRGSLAGMMN